MARLVVFLPQYTIEGMRAGHSPLKALLANIKVHQPLQAFNAPPEALAAHFGLYEPHIPWARMCAHALGLNVGAASWLCLEPVRVTAQRGRLILQGIAHIDLPVESPMFATLSELVSSIGCQLLSVRNGSLFLKCVHPLELSTHPWWHAWGRDISEYWPTGPDQKRWLSLFNELQMVLHAETIVDRWGSPATENSANAFWAWGEGTWLPTEQVTMRNVYADDMLPRILAFGRRDPLYSLTEFFAEGVPLAEDNLVVLGRCLPTDNTESARYTDYENQLIELLTLRKIKEVDWVFADGARGMWRPKGWRFWHR